MTFDERNGISEQLQIEKILQEKYKEYAHLTTSQELKKTCEKISSQHKNHYNQLQALL